jgi:hypothetical protein
VRRKERAMGTRRPLRAIHVERGRRPVRVDNEVDAPPAESESPKAVVDVM